MDKIAVNVRVTGRVQRVAFRAWARAEAERLGLCGWIRNEADGSVAALIIGPDDRVDAMLDVLSKGPPAARVAAVDTQAAPLNPDISGFRIIRR